MNEVRIQADALRKALAFAASATERRNTIPVLGMVKIDIANPTGTITGTDLDMEATGIFGIADLQGGPFSFLISPAFLSGVIRFAEGIISISKADDILTIKADDMQATARLHIPIEDWPQQKDVETLGCAGFGEALLHKALTACAVSISTEETRYYLNGVFFHNAGDGNLTLVATDGHKLTKYETGEPSPVGEAILPRKACYIVLRAMKAGGNGSIQVEASGKERAVRLTFIGDGWRIMTKCIDGTFPDYTRVIPKIDKPSIRFSLSNAALRRFPKLGDRGKAIKIDPDAGMMSMKDYDGHEVSMKVVGEGPACGFNSTYLKAFAALSGTISVQGNAPSDTFLIQSEDPKLTQVIMPMRI